MQCVITEQFISLWVKLTGSDKDGIDKDEVPFPFISIILQPAQPKQS